MDDAKGGDAAREGSDRRADEAGGLKRSNTSKEELDHLRRENEWCTVLASGRPPFLLHTSMHVTVRDVRGFLTFFVVTFAHRSSAF